MVSGKPSPIQLSADEQAMLNGRVRRRKITRADAQRAEIILRAADGENNCEIASGVGVTRQTVRLWRERFARHRLDGLDDEPRCGAPRKIGDDRIEEIVTKTLEAKPSDATHWSTRGMAKASGISASSVHRIWQAFCLQPHRTETFKLSTDPQFVEKVLMCILADYRRADASRLRLAAGKAFFAVKGVGSFGGIGAPAFR